MPILAILLLGGLAVAAVFGIILHRRAVAKAAAVVPVVAPVPADSKPAV